MTNMGISRREVLALGAMTPFAGTTLAGGAGGPAPATPAERRKELYGLLGDLPDRNRPVSGRKVAEAERDGYILETWVLDLNGLEAVPAHVARPRGAPWSR